jgi:hypothetical protein
VAIDGGRSEPPIRTEALRKAFTTRGREVRAVDGVDLEIRRGEFFDRSLTVRENLRTFTRRVVI